MSEIAGRLSIQAGAKHLERPLGGRGTLLGGVPGVAPGKVAIFVASSRFHGHEMREIGFRTYFRERVPEFEVIDTLVNPGSLKLAYDATRELLRQHPDLVGLNVAGFGPEGVIPALREANTAGRLAVVCNENTPDAVAALADDGAAAAAAEQAGVLGEDSVGHWVRSGPEDSAGRAGVCAPGGGGSGTLTPRRGRWLRLTRGVPVPNIDLNVARTFRPARFPLRGRYGFDGHEGSRDACRAP